MLTKKKREYFKKLLTKMLNDLSRRTAKTFFDVIDLNDKLIDDFDQASIDLEKQLKLRMRERESKLIVKIEDALERLENGSFGVCEECGQEISEKRLIARPVTTLCIDCKKEQEAAEQERSSAHHIGSRFF